MKEQQNIQDRVNKTLWAACDTFRGSFDSFDFRHYILVFMFLKYLSDVWKDRYEAYKKQYGNDAELIKRKMNRERFVLPPNCTFDYLYEHRHNPDIGEKIDQVLAKIEDQNREKLEGVFRNISFNSEKLGTVKERNRKLSKLIADFADPALDFRPSVSGSKDLSGNAYTYLIEKFAFDAGRKGGEFYTPCEVSELMARLIAPVKGARICDPVCGSGSLLITVAKHVTDSTGKPSQDFSLYAQETNADTWMLAKLNMFLHRMDAAHIAWGDTLNNPKLLEGDTLMKFDVVVANPPFSLDEWGYEEAKADRFNRYVRGLPPKRKGDFAFILHMIETTLPTGKVGVIVPHGVLFRSGAEGRIRQALIEENLLDAVVGLPANLFFGTGIPVVILVFRKARTTKDVLFIDASRNYREGKKRNILRTQDIDKIVKTYCEYKTVEKYACRAPVSIIKENDFNLSVSRYVHSFEQEERVNVKAIQKEIEKLEAELEEVRKEMDKLLKTML